ncbi:MAG: metalloregulator ArsR/SmtB family transcription factor [Candidatus Marinimicrobia bacterium]|jgi:ArsR family transcriptional regulator|nr:metalloregulator ArsR/SmtB family transcription factor [Candidatus Neomarinimicrobiota bacterium]MDD4960663.1 metalloregulator ArsR/SmtB family transcription factor [Candidatus Neomarinimicrobiota bacterium]MDD5709082.1 metalloregulator ArsR/SmtB family transcription factor [Candidatus Neomarinimicrobiota bacterium]MDX9778165.1 metalloregulator ArsR/SmtB family transcription factor [bacterium]
MNKNDYAELTRKAEILKAIAHPIRLSILRGLIKNGPTNVNSLETGIEVPMATVSQHLTKIRYAGVISKKRKGTFIYYSIKDSDGLVDMLKSFLETE